MLLSIGNGGQWTCTHGWITAADWLSERTCRGVGSRVEVRAVLNTGGDGGLGEKAKDGQEDDQAVDEPASAFHDEGVGEHGREGEMR